MGPNFISVKLLLGVYSVMSQKTKTVIYIYPLHFSWHLSPIYKVELCLFALSPTKTSLSRLCVCVGGHEPERGTQSATA